jgi:prepilin-type N-terminal cleavage/methylation domain-containing protein
MRFHNAAPASHKGFTLVEIAIVMIIIGLLVGGIFGGVRLLDNARVLRTINDLKSAESAALTFKTSYGRPPGDVRNPSLRLQNCTTPPAQIQVMEIVLLEL